MKCKYHPTIDSTNACHTCAKLLCGACSHQIKGNIYCQDCLINGAEWSATVRDLRFPKESAKRAALLALVPGMGAIYNGQYLKAAAFLVTFFSLAYAGGEIHGVFGWGAFCFYVFMLFDAYRSAEEIQRARLSDETLAHRKSPDMSSPVWGLLLILLGVLLTLFNFDIITAERFRKLWPFVVIIIGIYLIYRGLYPGADYPAQPATSSLRPEAEREKSDKLGGL